MFHLGRAWGYAIVPGKNTIETLNITAPCLEQNEENSISFGEESYRKSPVQSKFQVISNKSLFWQKLITWQEHRVEEPQCWQHRLMFSADFYGRADMLML